MRYYDKSWISVKTYHCLKKSHPAVAENVQRIVDTWTILFGEPDEGEWSIRFRYNSSGVAFRVESSLRPDGIPRIIVYPGDKDDRRGSPLIKGLNIEQRKDFSRRFDIKPRVGKNGDWEKILTEDVQPAFYNDFLKYALSRVKISSDSRTRFGFASK